MPFGRGKAIVAGEPMRRKKSQENKKQVQMPLQDRLLFLAAQRVPNRGCRSLFRARFFIPNYHRALSCTAPIVAA